MRLTYARLRRSICSHCSGSSIRRLGRDTMVYAIGTVLARTLSLVMLPIYTRNLTPADYGVLQLLEMTVELRCSMPSPFTHGR